MKYVALFSFISIIDLGFESLDFGRWVRNLFWKEYDLKAEGWLRMVSGLQSLVGLGLLALCILSLLGKHFE
jgi:nitric oxide reductase large subunit